MLPQIQQAVDIMLGNVIADPTAAQSRHGAVETSSDAVTPRSDFEPRSGRGSGQNLGGGEDAISKNSVEHKRMIGMYETVEAAALENRNFIQVIVGGEPYLALLDPGATI